MSCFISRKKDKISAVFETVGINADEESFIAAFKKLYPNDWLRINERWQLEEDSTPPGKKHSMQHPDVYMKEMYRNHKPKSNTKGNVMDLKDLKVKAIILPHGEYRLGVPVPVIDEGSFYRIDGTHIIDKFKIKSISVIDDRVDIVMTDKVVTLEVQQ